MNEGFLRLCCNEVSVVLPLVCRPAASSSSPVLPPPDPSSPTCPRTHQHPLSMAPLHDAHHTFIQSLMSRGPVTDAQATSMFRDLCGQDNGEFSQFIVAINKELNFLQLEVRAGTNQYDGTLYYGLVNKVGNEQAKMGTRYTHAQIAFFKAVLEAILSDASMEGKISNIQALNLRLETQIEQQPTGEAATQAPVLNLNFAQKERTLRDLTRDHWLSSSPDGMVALGMRAFLELWNVFKNYDVPVCDVCNEAGIKAQACQNEDCTVRMHDYCVKKRFHRAQVLRKCPECGTEWKSGDKEVDFLQEEEEDQKIFEPSQGGSTGPRRPLRQLRSSINIKSSG